MNLAKINEIRANMNLAPLAAKATNTAKKRQLDNQAARAQACRELKSLRGSGRKAK
jgi:hypothetical protein